MLRLSRVLQRVTSVGEGVKARAFLAEAFHLHQDPHELLVEGNVVLLYLERRSKLTQYLALDFTNSEGKRAIEWPQIGR